VIDRREIEECRLLEGLSDEEKEILSCYLERVSFEEGEILFDEFSPADAFYLLKEGKVGLYRSDNFGRWTKIAVVYGGTPLGECAFLLGKPHSLRAVAESKVKAFRIDRKSFSCLKEEAPSVLLKLLELIVKILSERLKSEDMKFSQVCGFFSVPGGLQWRR